MRHEYNPYLSSLRAIFSVPPILGKKGNTIVQMEVENHPPREFCGYMGDEGAVYWH
jgi:hypothetical protein